MILSSCHLWIRSDKFVDGSFSLHEHFSLLDFLDCFFIFVGELFGVVGELFFRVGELFFRVSELFFRVSELC